jgi:Vacuolar protein 14 C-terminal Fig4p binding
LLDFFSKYAKEFIFAIIHQLHDNPPESIVFKSLEVLARITVPVSSEELPQQKPSKSISSMSVEFPMNDSSIAFAMKILQSRQRLESRDREVFAALIQLHSDNQSLLADFSKVITYMCRLQPPEFVMVSFAVEVHCFLEQKSANQPDSAPQPSDLRFVSTCIQHMNHVLFNNQEARELRDALKDCIGIQEDTDEHRQRCRVFSILLHSFSHNIAATLSLCLWVGAYRTASLLLSKIDPLDINLIFLLEIDRLVEMLERPIFR